LTRGLANGLLQTQKKSGLMLLSPSRSLLERCSPQPYYWHFPEEKKGQPQENTTMYAHTFNKFSFNYAGARFVDPNDLERFYN
jgi:hypothetical protein